MPQKTSTTSYWLMKTEPDVFSLSDLKKNKTTWWEGVRNFQARNYMTQSMQLGDLVLFYHSSTEPPGVAGLARVCKQAEPDPTQFDKKSEYYDPRSKPEKPLWHCVQVEFLKEFPKYLSLAEIRSEKPLKNMLLLRKGQRLSIQPVTPAEFTRICEMGGVSKLK